jgi:hypothetical protein
MPVPDEQMPGLVWTKVAPGKWREVAPVVTEVAPVVTDDAADQSAKRARTLTFNDKKVADFKNWLDFLEHMDHDAYVTLMRYFVNVEAFEPQARLDGPIRARWNQNRPRARCHLRPGLSKYKEPEVNIYGLKYRTRDRQYFDYDDVSYYWIMSVRPSGDQNDYSGEKPNLKKHLLAAAEANGIKVYKSWSKPRLWKALLSA